MLRPVESRNLVFLAALTTCLAAGCGDPPHHEEIAVRVSGEVSGATVERVAEAVGWTPRESLPE